MPPPCAYCQAHTGCADDAIVSKSRIALTGLAVTTTPAISASTAGCARGTTTGCREVTITRASCRPITTAAIAASIAAITAAYDGCSWPKKGRRGGRCRTTRLCRPRRVANDEHASRLDAAPPRSVAIVGPRPTHYVRGGWLPRGPERCHHALRVVLSAAKCTGNIGRD